MMRGSRDSVEIKVVEPFAQFVNATRQRLAINLRRGSSLVRACLLQMADRHCGSREGALESSTAPLGRLDARTQVEMPARVARLKWGSKNKSGLLRESEKPRS